jgi:oxalate decarboxylase
MKEQVVKLEAGRIDGAAPSAYGGGGLAGRKNTLRAQKDVSASNPGPQNLTLTKQNPNSNLPPITDHGTVPPIWYSFELVHRRMQEGGWTHQITERELPSSKEIAAVQMRITAGSYRELHWHIADEWAYMLSGKARVTLLNPDGTIFIDDVEEGDLWLFPAGYPHSIQGLGDDGCEFLLVFNQGDFSEESTFMLSDWIAHTPPDVLAKNFRLPLESIAKLPTDSLYIFRGNHPESLEADIAETSTDAKANSSKYTFKLRDMAPTKKTAMGEARIVDGRNFPVSKKIAAALVTVKPGGLRELHWHPNASEWQYYIQGSGRMTVFNSSEQSRTMDFNVNDVGFVPAVAGHYVENTGDTDLVFLEMFVAPEFIDVSLNNWIRHLPRTIAMDHLGLNSEEIDQIPSGKEIVL